MKSIQCTNLYENYVQSPPSIIYIYIYKGIYTDTDMNLYMDGLHTTYELLNTFLDKNSTLEHYVNLLIYSLFYVFLLYIYTLLKRYTNNIYVLEFTLYQNIFL
ncbi:hypothetical protein YYC_04465 [Plasmodium yoelii 17X]|uniref:Uncharacterized protein n=1 Tax=Plasmodium yoelii 17X TaxID=1323249 RepID=V7PF59_PLAYE|nr:hypothetical protein YYC_04465 [Plasmodium yoelii 17X]